MTATKELEVKPARKTRSTKASVAAAAAAAATGSKETAKVSRKGETKMAVSETNIKKSAARLLSQALVSTEIQYIQRVLGTSATQQDVDDKVLAVRKMPWASIVLHD
jgi:hypothetical protein